MLWRSASPSHLEILEKAYDTGRHTTTMQLPFWLSHHYPEEAQLPSFDSLMTETDMLDPIEFANDDRRAGIFNFPSLLSEQTRSHT